MVEDFFTSDAIEDAVFARNMKITLSKVRGYINVIPVIGFISPYNV
jgi:hypothetical protein